MRFNVVTVPEETELEELPFSQTDIKTLKTAGCTTVGDVLHAFGDRSIFRSFDKEKSYEIALTICNPELTASCKTSQFYFLDEDTAVQNQLNASLLLLSEQAQRVLKRFAVAIPEQLGYVLTEDEYGEILDAAYRQHPRVYEILDRILRSIYDVYFSEEKNYEVNIRGQFAAETYNLEIQDVFREDEFKKFRQYCDDIGAVWIKSLAGFSPDLLMELIGADDALIDSVTERCKRIEQGDAKKYAGISNCKSQLTPKAKKAAIERHRRAASCVGSETSIYGENEIAEYTFTEPVFPSYMLSGVPVAFSSGYDVVMCSGWKDFLIKVLRFLYHEYPEKMKKLIGVKVCNSQPALLYGNYEAGKLARPRLVTSSIVAETDFSNEAIFDFVKELISRCNIPVQDFSITCFCSLRSVVESFPELSTTERPVSHKKPAGTAEHHLITVNFSERRIEFEAWLEEERAYSYTAVQDCVTSVNTASDWARDLNISAEDFFDVDNTDQLIQYCETLLGNRKFSEYERSVDNCDLDAINVFIDFCMDSDEHEGSENLFPEDLDLTAHRRTDQKRSKKEQLFEQWLSDSEDLDEIQAKRCIEAIYIASDWAKELSISARNLFEIKGAKKLDRVTDALLDDPQFSEYDTSKKRIFTKAIDMLVDYYYENE